MPKTKPPGKPKTYTHPPSQMKTLKAFPLVESFPNHTTITMGLMSSYGGAFDSIEGSIGIVMEAATRGTTKRTAQDIALEVDGRGAYLSPIYRSDFSGFQLRIQPEYFDDGLDLITDLATNATLSKEAILIEKERAMNRLHGIMADPLSYLFSIYRLKAAFGGGPLSKSIYGTEGSLQVLDPDTARLQYTHEFLTPPLLPFAIGSISQPEKTRQRLESSMTEVRPIVPSKTIDGSPGQALALEMHRQRAENAYMAINVVTPGIIEERTLTLGLCSTILGQSPSARIFREIRDKRGLSYIAFSRNDLFRPVGLFSAVWDVKSERLQEALTVMVGELKRLAEEEVPFEEFEVARNHLLGVYDIRLDNSSTMASYLVPRRLAGSSVSYREDYERFQKIQPVDVKRTWRDVLKERNISMAVVGDFDESLVKKAWDKIVWR